MGLLVLLIVLLLVFSTAIWITGGLIRLALHLFMAGLVGALADAVAPGRLPWGWLGAVLAGLVGSWLGVLLLGHLGPSLFGVPLLPGFVGALILTFALEYGGRALRRT